MADGIPFVKIQWNGLKMLANLRWENYQSKLFAIVFRSFLNAFSLKREKKKKNPLNLSFRLPQIQNQFGWLPGPFISRISRDETQFLSNQIRFSSTCPISQEGRGFHVRVKCPPMRCGVVKKPLVNVPKLRIRMNENERRKRDEYLRIIGGDRSGPHSWPYIVAVYKDGRFHCGGTIFNQFWVNLEVFLPFLLLPF